MRAHTSTTPAAKRPGLRWVSTASTVVALFLFLVFAGGCSGDEPNGPVPPGAVWVEVPLPIGLPAGVIWRIGYQADRGLAILLRESLQDGFVLLEENGSGWSVLPLPATNLAAPLDLAFEPDGRAVLAGFTAAGAPSVLAERPNWTEVPLPAMTGGLQSLARDGGGVFHAAGSGTAEIPGVMGTIDGSWTRESYPTAGDPQEKSIVDMAAGSGILYACGFDDGADGTPQAPFAVLMANSGNGWNAVAGPPGSEANHEFRAVEVNSQGALLLGGAVTDYSAGAPDPSRAFLALRLNSTPPDEWAQAELSQAGDLDRVNDILAAASGDTYLACGDSTAYLVWIPRGFAASVVEFAGAGVSLYALAEDGAGRIYAAGGRTENGRMRPLILRREETAAR